ncbi:hypothetical protein LMG8526HA_00356 [Lactococcus lactis]|nr:hypothetical protein [Lactococcus lactis]MDU0399512.1 hypothetical protein [Lactococcus lactis]
MIPKEIVIHRLTGDAPRDLIIGPMLRLKKVGSFVKLAIVLNGTAKVSGCKECRLVIHNYILTDRR